MDENKEQEINSQTIEPVVDNLPNVDIPAVRTYKNDINQTVNKDKISTAKILLAEQKLKEKESEKYTDVSIKRPTNILVLFLGVLLVISALGVIGYFGYKKVVEKTIAPIEMKSSFLFVFDLEKFIDSSKTKSEISIDIDKNIQEASSLKDNIFVDLVFLKTNPESKVKEKLSSSEFFNINNIKLPTNIARSISKDFTYGLYKIDNRVEPFLVVGIVDYENFYSSMFVWEQTLGIDMKDLFPVLKNLFDISDIRNDLVMPDVPPADNSTTTIVATSTNVSTSSEQVLNKTELVEKKAVNRSLNFIDVVFSNRDARAVKNDLGNPFFYYAFIEKDKIIFAQDPKILGEIIRKIKEKSLVR